MYYPELGIAKLAVEAAELLTSFELDPNGLSPELQRAMAVIAASLVKSRQRSSQWRRSKVGIRS